MIRIKKQAIPKGAIILWSGSIATIPTGWALCNGSNGTPDLRNRFVVCADADGSGVAKSTIEQATAKQTGGTKDHTHTFNFDFGGAGELDNYGSGYGFYYDVNGPGADYYATLHISGGGGGITDEQRIGVVTGYDLVPPFYALAYIMKL